MATKKAESNVIAYKDADERVHYASRTAPKVVKGLESGEYKLVEEVAPDAPKVPKPSDAPNPRPTGNGS